MTRLFIRYILFTAIIFIAACNDKNKISDPLFEVLSSSKTGINFSNRLTATDSFNVFKYMYFYNGAGVGAGDFNNDGLTDLFFASNQADNKIYINQGNLKFKDVTTEARIPQDKGWSTGVSLVDINNDGLLDIYVSKVGNFESLKSKNQMLVCTGIQNGVPIYVDKAADYEIDFSGFSTQAAFFDYDIDGDLDLFLLNHSVHQNGTFAERSRFLGTYHPLSGDRLYRNDGEKFSDVTKQCGIHSSAISYGLGIAVSDINLDGMPDLYIGNDFHENDYLYINQGISPFPLPTGSSGRASGAGRGEAVFKEVLNDHIMHTSQFSMGVDVADITNDGLPEIISVDMLPSDPYILKRSLGEDEYNTFYMKVRYGYNYQYTRNNLQLNRGNGMFSEVGLYSGIAASDWSWASLFFDFDNDGLKDLFISNGIPKRLNDIDYVNYVSNEEVQRKINANRVDEKEMAVIDKFPQIKIPNKIYRNKGNAMFEDVQQQIEGDLPNYSNGAAYADLDNDGDLDVVVNNIDDAVLIYKNNTNNSVKKSYLDLVLKGPPNNINAVGAKVLLFSDKQIYSYEKFPVHGFMSSMEIPLHIGLDKIKVDSAFLIWPDNSFQHLQIDSSIKRTTIRHKPGLPKFDYSLLSAHYKNHTAPAFDITEETGISFLHKENPFNEFDREPLIPFMVSREDPALAVGDANGDGLDDMFIGSAKREKSAVFFQLPNGKFQRVPVKDLETDSTYEDVDACWVDVNNDKHVDLVVASGGNEYYGQDEHLLSRVYLNDGKNNFKKLQGAFNVMLTASCIAPFDVNGDGFIDLFMGGRAVPWAYGQIPQSYLLLNDGRGNFRDATNTFSNELGKVGLVKSAVWDDLDKNNFKDLLIATEWGGIFAFMNNGGRLTKKMITDKTGWWNFLLPCDINNDGATDLIAGNLGHNTRLQATEQKPVRLYYNDFDENGKKEQIVTYYLDNKEIPFANKDELQRQMPLLKKKFIYASDFASATLHQLFSSDKFKKAEVLQADYFSNSILINDGKGNFSVQPLPWQAQLSAYKDAVIVNANGDNLPDILLAGNFYDNNIQMGRYDADFGTLLLNQGNGKFVCSNLNGLAIKGQVRHIRKIKIAGKESFVLAKNNDSTMVIRFGK